MRAFGVGWGQGKKRAGVQFAKVAGAVNIQGGGGVANAGDVAAGLLDWEEGDRFSFEDSDRFEEDSLCSWSTEPESVCNNWRGWKRPSGGASGSFTFQGASKIAKLDGESLLFVNADVHKKCTSFVCCSFEQKPTSPLCPHLLKIIVKAKSYTKTNKFICSFLYTS